MIFQRIYDEGLAQASFLLGCERTGRALVVDPRRDCEIYQQRAARQGLQIVCVLETHIHADYLSGARELAAATGAVLGLSGHGGGGWAYTGLDQLRHTLLCDGDVSEIGSLRVQALHTPGHTPEHLAYLVRQEGAAGPPLLLSGDFVFVGDLGRPDLLEQAVALAGTAEQGARQMWESLRRQFLPLPPETQVWPGHGAGSACGRALGTRPATTVGAEVDSAWWAHYVRADDQAGFVRELLAGQPEAPAYFARMKRLNRDGVPLLGALPAPPLLQPCAFTVQRAMGAVVVDTRAQQAFAGGHLPGAISVPLGQKFATWAGWLVPVDRPLVLVATPDCVADAVRGLVRVGLDQIVGYIPEVETYAEPGGLATVPQVGPAEALHLWESGQALVLDVRGAAEYSHGHIPGALHVPVSRIQQLLEQIPADRPLVVQCQGGDRSALAAGALLRAGFCRVANLAGGIAAWEGLGYPITD